MGIDETASAEMEVRSSLLLDEDRQSGEARRPRQNYFEMGLKSGDLLHFRDLPNETAEIVDEHHLRWRGELVSLTALRSRLGELYRRPPYTGPILSNGRNLDLIYDDTYGQKAGRGSAPRLIQVEGHTLPVNNVYIANFGRENYEWPNCLARGTVATMNAHGAHHFWLNRDRDGYINYCLKHLKTAAGNTPTGPVASRWFNLMTIISETDGDLWIHREKGQLWWTISRSAQPTIEEGVDPTLSGDQRVYVCHKPCLPWSNQTANGNRLDWNSLQPRAKEFLFTEGTLQKLSDDNAEYALALITSADLEPWHSRPEWKAKLAKSKVTPVRTFSAREKAAARMVMTAIATASASNGQEVLRTTKNKEVRFATTEEFEAYVLKLINDQDGLCAITGLDLGYDGCEDKELLCSLDRIDSEGHYEAGNLQVVCRFVNRWKNASDDAEFRRLIGLLKTGTGS